MEAIQDDLISRELAKCNRCGYCMATCPTYRVLREERAVARGRTELVREVAEGGREMPVEFQGPLFDCLLCGACTETCFGKVKTDELMVRSRETWYGLHGQPGALRFIFDQLLPHPDRLTRLMRLLSAGKRSGLAEIAQRLGVLRWINAAVDGASGLVATMPRLFLRDRLGRMGFERTRLGEGMQWSLRPEAGAPAGAPKVLFFVGCGTNYQVPRQGEAAIQVLHRAGCEVLVIENVCCGLPPYSYGDLDAARHLARQNLALMESAGFDLVVTECGSCSGFLRKWPALLAGEPGAAKAQEIAGRTREFSELMVELPLPSPGGALGVSVTYHDPCHLVRGQGIREQPRKLLRDVAGVTLCELPEADWCCGGAGSYNIAHPELSQQILARKVSRIQETGAEVVATACPSCVIQLAFGARTSGAAFKVKHVAELVAEALGISLIP